MSILSVIIDINSYIPCITFLITCINANSAHRISIIYTSMTILNIMALYDSHSFSGQQSCSFIMIFLDLDCALSKFINLMGMKLQFWASHVFSQRLSKQVHLLTTHTERSRNTHSTRYFVTSQYYRFTSFIIIVDIIGYYWY